MSSQIEKRNIWKKEKWIRCLEVFEHAKHRLVNWVFSEQNIAPWSIFVARKACSPFCVVFLIASLLDLMFDISRLTVSAMMIDQVYQVVLSFVQSVAIHARKVHAMNPTKRSKLFPSRLLFHCGVKVFTEDFADKNAVWEVKRQDFFRTWHQLIFKKC